LATSGRCDADFPLRVAGRANESACGLIFLLLFDLRHNHFRALGDFRVGVLVARSTFVFAGWPRAIRSAVAALRLA